MTRLADAPYPVQPFWDQVQNLAGQKHVFGRGVKCGVAGTSAFGALTS